MGISWDLTNQLDIICWLWKFIGTALNPLLHHVFETRPFLSDTAIYIYIYRGFKKSRYPQIIIQVLSPDMDGENPISIHFWSWFAIHRAILLGANKKSNVTTLGLWQIYLYSLWFVTKVSQQLTVAAMVFTQQLIVREQNHVFGRHLPSGNLT